MLAADGAGSRSLACSIDGEDDDGGAAEGEAGEAGSDEVEDGEGIGRSRCLGSIHEKRRMRCLRISSRSTSPDGDMLLGKALRSRAGVNVLLPASRRSASDPQL